VRLLFDENLSHRLCTTLVDLYPESKQVSGAGLARASDTEIWEFALRTGLVIVTLDADFADIAALRGAPPKVIWLRCGNQPTDIVAQIIRRYSELISAFVQDEVAACLELY